MNLRHFLKGAVSCIALTGLLFCCQPVVRAGAEELEVKESDGYGYTEVEDGSAVIKYYKGDELTLKVPESLDGHMVLAIGDEALAYCSAEEIELPDMPEGDSPAV